jgi:hypothetical protein
MAFSDYVYESDSATTFLIRLDTDQATLAGGVTGTPDISAHVRVSSSRREFGVQPRFVTCKRLVGAAPNQKTLSTKLACCTEAAYDALNVGSGLSINGVAYTVSSKTPEILR